MSWLLIITKLTYDYSLRRNEGIVGGLKPEDLGQKDFLDSEKKSFCEILDKMKLFGWRNFFFRTWKMASKNMSEKDDVVLTFINLNLNQNLTLKLYKHTLRS